MSETQQFVLFLAAKSLVGASVLISGGTFDPALT